MSSIAAFLGRILLSAIFILSGLGKILYQADYNQSYAANPYLNWLAAPGQMAVPLGIFELVAGILILFGFLTRITSVVLAIYAVLTAIYLHLGKFAEPLHQQIFLQWLAIAGGLLLLFAYGNTRYSFDRVRRRNTELADERDLERERARELERATRAVPAEKVLVERDPVTGEERIIDRTTYR